MVNILDDYIMSVTNPKTVEEMHILDIINNAPIAPNGFGYKLTKKLEWKLIEIKLCGK